MSSSRVSPDSGGAALGTLAARLAEQCLQAVFVQDAVGVLVTELDGRLIQANQKFCDLIGYSQAALGEFTLQEYTDAQDWVIEAQHIARLLAGEVASYRIQKRFAHHAGHGVWVGATASAVLGDAGEPVALLALIEDLNDRKRPETEHQQILRAAEEARSETATARQIEAISAAVPDGVMASDTQGRAQRHMERALIQQAHELEAIFASVADGVVVYGAHGEPLRYNPAALAILGWSEVELDPRTLTRAERDAVYDLHYLDGTPVLPDEQPSMRAVLGQTTEPVIYSLRQPGGRRVVLNARAAPLRDARTHQVTGAVLILRDVTLAQHLDQMKDEFIDIASHELRAPLTPLILASRRIQQLIGQPDQEAKARRFADEMVTHAKHMSRLVEDMLSMTRIEAGRFVIEKEACDLALTLSAAIAEQEAAWKRTISREGLDAPLPCQADAGRMWQVITNLLSNAMKYTPSVATVTVSAKLAGRGALRKLRVAVRDTGSGIAADALPHLFDRFYRVPLTAEDHREGLGLGLYITRAIVEGHGGRIWVESRAGVGTTFFFDIPVH